MKAFTIKPSNHFGTQLRAVLDEQFHNKKEPLNKGVLDALSS